MTDTPADPIAAEARRLVETLYVSTSDLSAASCEIAINVMADMVAAFGHRMKAAGRAEASAWRRISKDCLPEDGKYYLVWAKFPGRMDVYMFERRQVGWSWQGLYGYEPTHFMPLPPPPEGGE